MSDLRLQLEQMRQPNANPSCLHIDRLVAGDLSAADDRALRDLATRDPAVQRRIERSQRDAERFAGNHTVATFLRRAKRRAQSRPTIRWLRPAAVIIVAGVAGALLVVRPVEHGPVRTKGDDRAELFVKRGSEVMSVDAPPYLLPDDRVQLALTSEGGAFVALLAADAANRVMTYLPVGGSHPVWLRAGEQVPTSSSAQLDQQLGDEVWVTLVCSEAIPLLPLQQSLKRWVGANPGMEPPADWIDEARCTMEVRTVTKGSP